MHTKNQMAYNNRSQIRQDERVLNFYHHNKQLFFVEVGANDGIYYSNTLYLEQLHGWRGMCIEPDPEAFKRLLANRPLSIPVNKAAYSVTGKTLEFSVNSLLSGITEHLQNGADNGWQKISVETETLNDMLARHQAPEFINYLSVDVEGAELEVLAGIDFEKYRFGYITIEHNYEEPKRTEIRRILRAAGYYWRGPNFFDDDYIHKSLIEGTYYVNGDKTKPVYVEFEVQGDSTIKVVSDWLPIPGRKSDIGQICGHHDSLTVYFFCNDMEAIMYYDSFRLNNGTIWKKTYN